MRFPCFGAFPDDRGVDFRVMVAAPAPAPRSVQLVVHTGRAAGTYPMNPAAEGVCEIRVAGATAGDRYGYRLGRGDLRPDPASRFQPEGVHGPSEIVDPNYSWNDAAWRRPPPGRLVVYELHVGTFTPEGTFDAARRRLPELRALGVTAIELMPVGDFAGSRNWGYDGVSWFAPARAYGRPADLRAFVDAAHGRGLAVMLDVVYNHLGPEGAYLTEFNPTFLTDRYSTPWGAAVNLDGAGSPLVRRFIIDNALHWVREYHLDGLRLDATHALIDESPVHLAAELAAHLRGAVPWPVALHAEDHRNLASIVQPPEEGGWGLDAVWADDFHHVLRRLVAGDSHGYFRDYRGTAAELADIVRQGWLFTGQPSTHLGRRRGTDPARVPMQRSVICLQNHDQVGNRAHGERLHHQIDAAAWRAVSTVLLTAPMTPLLFMGQEWAAGTPFLYFTDLEAGLGRSVTEGRRREFRDFPSFNPALEVPDPQAERTFESSKLRWEERSEPAHAASLALYSRLLELRAESPALQASARTAGEAWAAKDRAIVMRRTDEAEMFMVVAQLLGGGEVRYEEPLPARASWHVVLTTEEAAFAPDPEPPEVTPSGIAFRRPGAVVLRRHF